MRVLTWSRLKLLISLAVLGAAVCLTLWNIPHSEQISWSGAAVEYDLEDAGYQADHEVTMNGQYSFRRDGTETFEGPFLISGLELGKRSRITFAGGVGEAQFYDEAGQPFTAPVSQVIPLPDASGAVVLLYGQYTAEDGQIRSALEGQRFLCLGALTRQEAIDFLDSLKD